MKQEWGRLRATAEQEEIDGAHSEGVYEIVPMQDTDEMYRHLAETNLRVLHGRVAQTSCRRPVCGFNKQGACLSHDVGKFVI